MSIKSKVFAAAASLTMVGGLGAGALATAGAANAATPSCGTACVNIFNEQFPISVNHPSFVIDVYKQGQNIGQPIILFRASNSDPAEDFTYGEQGTVADFFAAGLVSSAVALHYGCIVGVNFPDCFGQKVVSTNLNAFELEYAPFGADTGLCMGVGATAASGTKVSLQPCGVSSKTVWIEDWVDGMTPSGAGIPLINGSDTNFSHPFVLTYPASAYPTDKPRPQLYTANLTGFSQGNNGGPILSTVTDNQLWTYFIGTLD
jgi:hypothetical protein